jgi:uncharacterized iron-regulated membrane protein
VLWLRKSEEATGALSGYQVGYRKLDWLDAHATSGFFLLILLPFLFQLVFLAIRRAEQGTEIRLSTLTVGCH